MARVHHAAHLASATAKPTGLAAKPEAAASRVKAPPASSQTRPADSATAAAAAAAHANVAESHPADLRMIEAQVTAATVLAERMTAVTATPAPDTKTSSQDSSNPQTVARGDAPAPADDTDRLVAVLMARPDVKSVSDLAGKTIAIDDRYTASSGTVRTAIVAAGAPEVQLSEGKTTAINRLVGGEVLGAVLALVSPDAAERFPAIAGYKIFHIPLSPRSVKGRP